MAGVELKPMGRHAGPSTTSLPPPYTDDNKGASSPSAPPRDSAPGTLGSGYRTAAERARLEARHTEDGMDAVSVYGLVVAGW
jgi:hypothetical protein